MRNQNLRLIVIIFALPFIIQFAAEACPSNQAPQAVLGELPSTAIIGQEIVFDATSSTDPDGSIVKCEFYFGGFGSDWKDEINSPNAYRVTHAYSKPGTYNGYIAVWDNLGGFDAQEFTIKIYYRPFGMAIESVANESGTVAVQTTGAIYEMTSSGISMKRRIDPATNDYSEEPLEVATLDFSSNNLSNLIVNWNEYEAVIESDQATFTFEPDSLFFVKAKQSFSYDHNNLINDAPWNAPLDTNYRHLDRLWTGGYGGSLHAKVSGTPSDSSVTTDKTTINMDADEVMAHMVFPPKKFDFERLYGAGKRPFVEVFSTRDDIEELMAPGQIASYVPDGFGVFVMMGCLYDNPVDKNVPVLLRGGILGYKMTDDALQVIDASKPEGFKVLGYLTFPSNKNDRWKYPTGHPKAGQYQPVSVTLGMMKDLQDEYGLDGWYLDNGDAGDFMEDYNFIRQLRSDLGDDGIIYHHESRDVWGWELASGYYEGGLKAVFYDAYVNYTLNGEVDVLSEVDSPNDGYMRYYSCEYGLSQAIGEHKRNSTMKTALSAQEVGRLMGGHLHGGGRTKEGAGWEDYFKPAYDARKNAYQAYISDPENNEFDFDVQWPIDDDPETGGWFRTAVNPQVSGITSNSVTITWDTPVAANTEVTWTKTINGWFWPWWDKTIQDYRYPAGTYLSSIKTTDHSMEMTGLDAETTYEFRIRSTNDTNNPPNLSTQIIWGYVGSFTTLPEE